MLCFLLVIFDHKPNSDQCLLFKLIRNNIILINLNNRRKNCDDWEHISSHPEQGDGRWVEPGRGEDDSSDVYTSLQQYWYKGFHWYWICSQSYPGQSGIFPCQACWHEGSGFST